MQVAEVERQEVKDAEKEKYFELLNAGAEVSNTEESVALRNYKLRSKKRQGFLRKHETCLADDLFPEELYEGDTIAVFADLVASQKRPVPYGCYQIPGCPAPSEASFRKTYWNQNLGMRLQGHSSKVASFELS